MQTMTSPSRAVSASLVHTVLLRLDLHGLIYLEVDLFFLPGKYTTDNWEKGGGSTITPLSGSPYVVRDPSHVAGMCRSDDVGMPQIIHLKLHLLYTPTS